MTVDDLFEEVIGELPDGPAARQPVFETGKELRAPEMARLEQIGEQLASFSDIPTSTR